MSLAAPLHLLSLHNPPKHRKTSLNVSSPSFITHTRSTRSSHSTLRQQHGRLLTKLGDWTPFDGLVSPEHRRFPSPNTPIQRKTMPRPPSPTSVTDSSVLLSPPRTRSRRTTQKNPALQAHPFPKLSTWINYTVQQRFLSRPIHKHSRASEMSAPRCLSAAAIPWFPRVSSPLLSPVPSPTAVHEAMLSPADAATDPIISP